MPNLMCLFRFASEERRSEHEKRAHRNSSDEKKPNVCDICQKRFSSKQNVKSHILYTHVDSAARDRLQCNVCQKWLSNCYSLKAHLKLHSSEPLECPYCNQYKPNKATLRKHIKLVHNMDNSLLCRFCDKAFKTSMALSVSIKQLKSEFNAFAK